MGDIFSFAYRLMQIPLTLEGVTFTLWQVFLFFAVTFISCKLVFGIFK